MPDYFGEGNTEAGGSLQSDYRQALQELDDAEQALSVAEQSYMQTAREKRGNSAVISAAMAQVTAAERARDRAAKLVDRLESQTLTAKRQAESAKGKPQTPTTRTQDGRLYQYNPTTDSWEPAIEGSRDSAGDSLGARRFEYQQLRDSIRDQLAADKMSLAQAQKALEDERKRIEAELRAEYNQAQIEATQRGQDIVAETSRRGQDLNYAQGMAQVGTSAMMQSLPFLAPEGTAQDLAGAINALSRGQPVTVAPRSAPFPFNPMDIGRQIAAMALQGISPAAAAAGAGSPPAQAPTVPAPVQVAPQPAQPSGFVAPSAPTSAPPAPAGPGVGFTAPAYTPPSLANAYSSGNRYRPV